MATPHVSGAAALVWSRSDVTSNSQVVDILLNSADGRGVAPGRLDSWTIHGGLNLHDAVSYGLTNLPPHAVAGPDQTVPDIDRDGTELVTLDGTASSDTDGSIVSYEWSEGGTSIGAGAAPTVWLAVGVHTLTLEVKPDALVTVRCGDVTLTEGKMGRVGDRVSVRVAKPLRRPRTTFAMFEKADESTNRMETTP